jgi:EAL domain-containing protein (putative c-di-GMP-specific phosphodiesterase class I)
LILTYAIGICPLGDFQEVEAVLNNVKLACNNAIRNKEKFFIFDEEMKKSYNLKSELRIELYNGILNDEIELFYQPQHNIETGKIIGLEALVRWNNRNRGMLFPDSFIPLAEEDDLICILGEKIIDIAFKFYSKISSMYSDSIRLSINISVIQLNQPAFDSFLVNKLKEYNINPKFITLELTESIMSKSESIRQVLSDLRNIGFEISLDDFGTGYSSLSYLKNFPIDELKIDKSFIFKINNSSIDLKIVQYIIELAHALNLKIVAEGVELIEHLNLLKKINCDIAQGYYLSKPINSTLTIDYINNSQKEMKTC